MRHFVLHARLTKHCNADCTYCSSWQERPETMSTDAFRASIDFLAERVLPLLGFPEGSGGHCSVQYVGGEVLTVPRDTLRGCVLYARQRLGRIFTDVRDGAQSNLIGSQDRVLGLATLFGGRLGTSVDSFGSQRRVSGKAELYRQMAERNRQALSRRRKVNPSAIFVVDREGIGRVEDEMARADEAGYGLVLRPVFRGGSEVHPASIAEIREAFGAAFDGWAMRSRVSVQPFFHLLAKRVATLSGPFAAAGFEAGCPFQNDCALVSLDLEPDGTLYVCLDMADSGQFPLGNALEGRFEKDVWEMLAARREHLDTSCRTCPWRRECQGGCMSEAIHASGSPYGKTELCEVWKALFARMDALIEARGAEPVRAWMEGLSG